MGLISILTGLFPSFLLVGLEGIVRDRLKPEAWQAAWRFNTAMSFVAVGALARIASLLQALWRKERCWLR